MKIPINNRPKYNQKNNHYLLKFLKKKKQVNKKLYIKIPQTKTINNPNNK